jgi:energy-coupling factor transporter transmembrane protein EcfT
MTANQRGCRSLIITIAVIVGIALFQIWFLPTVLGTGVTLPVITVPPEKYLENWPSPELDDFFVNTLLGGALLADILVIIFVALFIGLTIDRLLGVRGPATICLLVLSVPVSLFLMIQIALRLVRQVEPSSPAQKKTSRKSLYEEKEE